MGERMTGESVKGMSWMLEAGARFQIETSNPDGRDWRIVEVPEGEQVVVGRGDLRNQSIKDKSGQRVGASTVGQGITLGKGLEIEGIYVGPGTKARIIFPQKGVKVAPKLTKDENRH